MNLRCFATLLVLVAGACGGTTAVDPIVRPASSGEPAAPPDPGALPGPTPGAKEPSLATGPYTGLVGTTDVSILYPLPISGGFASFVQPSEAGAHGPLLPAAFVDVVLGPEGGLERTTAEHPSKYADLRIVSVRLDPCSARGNGGCRTEVRVVLQALYNEVTGAAGDPVGSTGATDGGVHVMYDVPEPELVTMMKQILTLKKANGDLATQELGPHPILAAQGADGAFAKGLRSILLEHLGEARIGRVTAFDHNFNPEMDGWTFSTFDRSGATLTQGKIPFVDRGGQTVAGSDALVALTDSSAETFSQPAAPDQVNLLVRGGRPAPGSAGVATLQPALEAALRIQNPTLHNAETTDCANCHLAEGARNVGESLYALKSANPANGFKPSRSVARKDERTSVTNLHAFSYLHRKISVMARTAHESILAADRMEAKVK